MQQIELFEIENQVTEFVAKLFAQANAGGYDGKDLFYRFKDFFLARHAIFAGYARQTIIKTCHSCDGTGIFHTGDRCWNCSNGIYETRIYYLRRYGLNGRIYHCSLDRASYNAVGANITEEIDGYIRHDPVDEKTARRAAIMLFVLNWRIGRFYLLAMLRRKIADVKWKLHWQKKRLLHELNPRNHLYFCSDCMKPLRFFRIALGDHSCCDVDRLPF